jgi:serine protease Do
VNISVDETAQSIAEAVAIKASDSVVGIRTTTSVTSFFGGTSDATGEGSGVIYKEDGYIITNYHVIEEAVQSNNSKIEVFVGSKDTESHLAQVIGYNISTDLAVIKINAKNLKAAEIGSSKDLSVGQYVITIGAPGGLEFMGSVTYGIISGLDRVVSANTGLKLIQTDAAINPGNSGGALLNAKGQLIGINSSKIVAEEFEGMGFAIPIATVVEKCDKIIARKDEPAPYVGISISERYTREVLSFYGYPAGAVVSGVIEGSPADLAGIRRGDIITELNGTAISEYTVFGDVLHDLEPNQKVSIKIYRSGRTYDATITIGSDSAQ